VRVELLSLWLLGMEVTRFAPSDDTDAVLGSLSGVQSGSFSLSPYVGPAIQPYLTMRRGGLELGIAPALSVSRTEATDGDGATATAGVVQWRGELRARWCGEFALAGVDGAISGGRATLDGEPLADGPRVVTIAPTFGARASLSEHLGVVGRARLPVLMSAGSTTAGLGGAVSLEWAL
jgi:hypothetical protein